MSNRALALLLGLVLSPIASANVADAVNEVRASGCGRIRGIETPLHTARDLSAAARRMSDGESLDEALIHSGYRARRSASLRISGNMKDAAVANTLRSQFCAQIMEPSFRDIGFFDSDQAVWMIVAAPFDAPSARDASALSRRVLELTNEARARGYRCGASLFAPSKPLKLNDKLRDAALEHSRDMASRSTLSHDGSDGTKPAGRAERAGYPWKAIGENVAAGPVNAEDLMHGWLASPQHCSNIMDARFTEMAVAFVVDEKSKSVIYWTQMFGVRR
jgi:uncharacterized protein YkwD